MCPSRSLETRTLFKQIHLMVHICENCLKFLYVALEIKLCGLGPRIRDVEAFWYQTEFKIIYFLPFVFDCV